MRTLSILIAMASAFVVTSTTAERYNYRTNKAYTALDSTQQKMLDRVHRDFVLLWGALDMYAEDHNGQVPKTLAELTPLYLKELPADPFATSNTAKDKDLGDFKASLDGRGYRYRAGGGNAFVISSVGQHRFPYLAARGSIPLRPTA